MKYMNYSNNYFGKNLNDLEYSDIENFFLEEKEETNNIEFKSYSTNYGNLNKNIEGVIRGICAFLNSDGGILIWGAPEGEKIEGRKEKVFEGKLSPVPQLLEKDWLINKISDTISPLPIRINVKILEKKDNYLYIFEIQQSDYSPHQFKNIYYARIDGQTKPAPHYLIEALFKKIRYPRIEGFIKPERIDQDGSNYLLTITVFIINFTEFQNEQNISFRLVSPHGKFYNNGNIQENKMYIEDDLHLIYNDFVKIAHFGGVYTNTEMIIINPYEIANNENIIELHLSFSGKYSPLKSSTYKLDLSLIDWNNKEEPNYLIVDMEENILYSELQKEKNMSRKKILSELLKR